MRTCSYAVRDSFVHLAFAVLALVICGAAEELLPKFYGVGFPLLLAASHLVAVRWRTAEAVLFALAAGALEDSVSTLPMMTSASFYLLVSLPVKWTGFPAVATILSYPVYHLWLAIWAPVPDGGTWRRALVAVPMACIAAYAASAVFAWAQRKAAVGEQD